MARAIAPTPLPIRTEPSVARGNATQSTVNEIFAALTTAGVPSCILRNRELIPDGLLGWKDIDILVPGDVSARDLVRIFGPLQPEQIGSLRRGQTTLFFPVTDMYLRVDIFQGNLRWKSADFQDHRTVLAQRRDDAGYAVASPLHQAFIVVCSKLLWDGHLPAHYESMIEEAIRQDRDGFLDLAERAFGLRLAHEMVHLASAGQLAGLSRLAPAFRRALWRRALVKHPLRMSFEFSAQIAHGVAQRMRPSGVDVALLGPDGCGKTTVMAEIAGSPLRNVAFKKIVSRKGYRHTLPPLGSVAGFVLHRSFQPVGTALDPHGAPPHSAVTWFAKFMYYTLDRWLDQISLQRDMAHTSLILRDRHLMEVQIDPRRYRYVGPRILPQLVARLQPRPTMIIVLDAPTEVIQARKQEVPADETRRQRGEYLRLARSRRNGYVVDSDQPLRAVVRDVVGIINSYTQERTSRRFYPAGQPQGTSWLGEMIRNRPARRGQM